MENLKFLDYLTSLLEGLYKWSTSQLPAIIVLIIVTFIILRLNRFLTNRLKKTIISRVEDKDEPDSAEAAKRIETLLNVLRRVIRMVVWTVFIIILLSKLGLNIGPILAGAGIIGLAIGFGAQELVRDFISGFFILLENQVRKGDVAVINGTGGMVEAIKLRTITLRDFAGTIHVFQNGKINSLSNMTKTWSASVFDIGVAYKEDTDVVAGIMKEVGEDLMNDPDYKNKIIEPLEIAGVDKLTDSAVIIKARMKTLPVMQWSVQREYLRRLKKAFDSKGIEIPFPHTTIYWGEKIDSLNVSLRDEKTRGKSV
ncbi:MAG: mechanosensitive ion channel protein MscS [Bacteroides sp. SM23_62_1]|nr:MAG: mechanosensitive ion channel protein MscS [Bacteroides sp. SM23_62_1]